jgi:hypothetical protein
VITGRTYDVLKWITQILLPALGALYFIGASIWGFSHGETVLGIIFIVDLVLGALLWISQAIYKTQIGQGDLLVDEDSQTGEKGLRLVLDHTPEELVEKQEVRFKVRKSHQTVTT